MRSLAVVAVALSMLPSWEAMANISRNEAKVQCVTKARQFAPRQTQFNRSAGSRHATAIYRSCMREFGHRP